MLYAEEMDRRLNRHYRFWGERFEGEGAYIAITAPDETTLGKYQEVKASVSLEQKWFDIDYRIKSTNYKINTTYYGGDSIPTAYIDFGPGVLPAFLGAGYRLDNDTIWFDDKPIILEWNNIPNLQIQKDSKIYKIFEDMTKSFCKDSEGKYIPSIADIGVNLDVLTSLRKRENLLVDLIRNPEEVKRTLINIDIFWSKVFDENVKIISNYNKLITSWIPLVNKNTWYPLLSEFSVMISPTMFQDIVLPSLQREIDHLEQALFYLDGEDQVKLLPTILQLKGLHSIEWDPIPKFNPKLNKMVKDFASEVSIDVYKKIKASGKKIVIKGVLPEQVEKILEHISPDGVFFFVNCDSRKSSEEFLAFSNKWIKK